MDPSKETDQNVQIVILVTEFNKNSNKYGGAVHLTNCGVKCDSTKFISCKSEEGGGGSMYVKNSAEMLNSINLNGLVFDSCTALYGGGAYLYSSFENNTIKINYCTFKSNRATQQMSTESMYGGSAIYLASDSGELNGCTFSSNKGKGGSIKVVGLSSALKSIQILSKNSFEIFECSIEIDKDSESSIFYSPQNDYNKLSIRNCLFTGDLDKYAHHIDGHFFDLKPSKMIVQNCKFSCDKARAFNTKSINKKALVKIDNQFNGRKEDEGKILNASSLASYAAGAFIVMVIVLSVLAVVVRSKRHSYSEDQNEDNETPNEASI